MFQRCLPPRPLSLPLSLAHHQSQPIKDEHKNEMGKRKSSKKPQTRVKQVLGQSLSASPRTPPTPGPSRLSLRAQALETEHRLTVPMLPPRRQVFPMHVLRQDRLRHLQDVRTPPLPAPQTRARHLPLIPVPFDLCAHRDTKNRVGRLQCKDCNQSFQVRLLFPGLATEILSGSST